MVKVKPKGTPAPGTEAAEKAKKAPAKKAAAKKAPAKNAGDLSRAAMADEPKEGDRQRDDKSGVDMVFHNGKWVPAAGQTWGGGPMTSEQASEPDKAPAGGWGTAADADREIDTSQVEAGAADDAPPAGEQGTIGWDLLSGREQIVDEEGEDASEAGKVAQSRRRTAQQSAPPAEGGQGHNLTAISKDLVAVVERAERVMEEIGTLKDDLKEIMAEAKQKGYSTAILREAIRRRAMDADKRKEHDDMLALYEEALRGK